VRKERREFPIASGGWCVADSDARGCLRRREHSLAASRRSRLRPERAQAGPLEGLRQDLWRAGHAHAGVLLVLSLVTLRYVDEAALPEGLKSLVRHSIPAAAILLPLAFFLSVLSPEATEPNAMIYLAYLGAVSLAVRLLTLGVGLVRRRAE
jgi:hypothetical protein